MKIFYAIFAWRIYRALQIRVLCNSLQLAILHHNKEVLCLKSSVELLESGEMY